MIKFFRKIRQKLLSENKFSKYLIYATGEIALVMIGILLALQVNNWNEKRKANITEKALVNSFIETINSDKDLFEEHQTVIEQIDLFHRNLYLIGVEKKELTDIGNPNLVRRIPQDGILSIDDFPNITGQLSNETIKKSITEYYNEIKIYREVQLELRGIVTNKIRPFLGNENVYDLKQWYNPQKEMANRPNFVSKEKLIDLSKIPLFQQLLIQANLKIYSMSIFSERLIETNRSLYETLKTELRNY